MGGAEGFQWRGTGPAMQRSLWSDPIRQGVRSSQVVLVEGFERRFPTKVQGALKTMNMTLARTTDGG